MRHRKAGSKFNRTANQRKALLRGLMSALILNERIETTLARAKETRKLAERLVTHGVKGDLHSRRIALAEIDDKAAVMKLFNTIAPRFEGRNGGYLRIVQTRRRVGDGSEMAVLEFVDYEELRGKKGEPEEKKEKKEKKASGKGKKASPEEEKEK